MMTPADVAAVFCTVEAARCSHNVRARGLSVIAYAWRKLLAAGYPAEYREALLAAGVRQALDTMPYLGEGTGDFDTDADLVLSAVLSRSGLPRREPSLVFGQLLSRRANRYAEARSRASIAALDDNVGRADVKLRKIPPLNSNHKGTVEPAFRGIHELLLPSPYQAAPAAPTEGGDKGNASPERNLDDLQQVLLEQLADFKPHAEPFLGSPLQTFRRSQMPKRKKRS
jgi:hypothetical protein